MRRKTVCWDVRMLGPCGIGSYLGNLLPFFKEAPFHFYLLVDPREEHRFTTWNGVDIIPLPTPIYSLTEQIKLPKAIPRCDLFWSPHYNVPLFPIAARKRLVTIHDVYHLAHYDTLSAKEKIYATVMMRAAARLSHHVITVSHFSKSQLLHFLPLEEKKVQVIYSGINSTTFHADPKRDKSLLAPYHLPPQFLLFVGHIRHHKNLQGVVRALDQIVSQGEESLPLVVIGKRNSSPHQGIENKLLAEYPHLKSKILLLGNVAEEHLAAFYRQASALLFPSFYEGFGLPPLEAMSAGCPVIVARCAALPEVCGDAAIYVDPSSPADIAHAILHVVKSDAVREDLKRKGWDRCRTFGWKKCAESHVETIERLLQR